MIRGLGIDIVEIDRVRALVERTGGRALERLLSEAERAARTGRANPYPHYAGRFAAKEAVMKALGTGWAQGVHWDQIEILNDDSGAPVARLTGRAAERLREIGGTRLLVSISHSKHYAVAQAIVEG